MKASEFDKKHLKKAERHQPKHCAHNKDEDKSLNSLNNIKIS